MVTSHPKRSIRVPLPCNSHRGVRERVRECSSSFQYPANPFQKFDVNTKGRYNLKARRTEMMM